MSLRSDLEMLPVNPQTYRKMTDEDIELIKKEMPESFQRNCIIERMEMANKYYEEVILQNKSEKDWNG
jgi:hypothetical protein